MSLAAGAGGGPVVRSPGAPKRRGSGLGRCRLAQEGKGVGGVGRTGLEMCFWWRGGLTKCRGLSDRFEKLPDKQDRRNSPKLRTLRGPCCAALLAGMHLYPLGAHA